AWKLPKGALRVTAGAKGRRKTLLVADMESTIIANEFVNELAELAGAASRSRRCRSR
ncbi:hypothetical protein LCGC14_2609710, partial [marine sediment metagenome]